MLVSVQCSVISGKCMIFLNFSVIQCGEKGHYANNVSRYPTFKVLVLFLIFYGAAGVLKCSEIQFTPDKDSG